MVLSEGHPLTKVAKTLHIKRPTAKVILKRYKLNGTYFLKKNVPTRRKDLISTEPSIKMEEDVSEKMGE